MRTLGIIAGGLVLLGVFAVAGERLGTANVGTLAAAKLFIPIWLVVALINMWIGVSRAGYSLAEEFPIFLGIFVVPAGAAAFAWWKLS